MLKADRCNFSSKICKDRVPTLGKRGWSRVRGIASSLESKNRIFQSL